MIRQLQWTRGETLGKGGFGFVSIAKTHQSESGGNNHHLPIPPLIAVKSSILSESKTLWMEKGLLEKFKGCPSIIRCFGDDITTTDTGEKFYNILLEYASGGCLADHIVPKKGMPENMVSRCTKSILTALVHIHKLGYVHCDVKPHNMLLVGGDAKLADFGTCTSIDDGKFCAFRGTVVYAAPESIAWNKFVPESDIWGLGCSVLQMLTGKPPWVLDDRRKDVLFKIGSSTEIPTYSKKISKEAKDFLSKCLVKDPTARWKADMLLDHPFVKKVTASRSNCSSRNHIVSSRLSHRGMHAILPHCFHVPKVQVC
ncbi:mitogen-activated protein kinase kinase kinase npk1 [Phtheirospermum japonicum]|uniref:Mitogen-activated protein kinase kinase kinase npk1 n=1 Tax=Phtheirospermum japonicum TaxID=374723 RepID=A0A830C7S9_9LAMI|nr:mitogen-activated protein kinase kinase kinase npk1 [Phtheirospermum japonicum]